MDQVSGLLCGDCIIYVLQLWPLCYQMLQHILMYTAFKCDLNTSMNVISEDRIEQCEAHIYCRGLL